MKTKKFDMKGTNYEHVLRTFYNIRRRKAKFFQVSKSWDIVMRDTLWHHMLPIIRLAPNYLKIVD